MITLKSSPQASSMPDSFMTGPAIESAIISAYPHDYIKISDLAWLIEDKNAITPQSVDNKILNANPNHPTQPSDMGAYLISSFNGYWGYHDNSIWQWLQSRGL